MKTPAQHQGPGYQKESVSKQSGSKATSKYAVSQQGVAQMKRLQHAAKQSPQVMQLKRMYDLANRSASVQKLVQMQKMADRYTTQRKATTTPAVKPPGGGGIGNGLPAQLQASMEQLTQTSLSDVKVHYNSAQPAQLQAHAYAQGNQIHLGPGQEKHLPHELGHVVQQKQGRVQPTVQMRAGVNINDDAQLEREADQLGEKAIQMKTAVSAISEAGQGGTSSISVVQRRANNQTVDFEFDNLGARTNPPGGAGATNPDNRVRWLNPLINDNILTHGNLTANYQSGHQIAHRWHGADNGDNVVAWTDNQETTYGQKEDHIDMGNANDRKDEKGTLTVNSTIRDDANLIPGMVAKCLDNLWDPYIKTKANWKPLWPANPAATPPTAINKADVTTRLENNFNTQQYRDTAKTYMSQQVVFDYAAKKPDGKGAYVANAPRSLNYDSGAIALPTWQNDVAGWKGQISQKTVQIKDAGNNHNYKFDHTVIP